MAEIGEIIAVPVPHATANEKCPFCPPQKPPPYVTHPGSANDSDALAKIMVEPAKLVPLQASARPKQGDEYQQSVSSAQPKPDPIFSDAAEGAYSCEAHHLISGKQALANHAFERWILASKGTIESDSGYSVNNADNGLWAPSIPEKYKAGGWGPLSFQKKLDIAKRPMEGGLPQFHKGHHGISDPDDPEAIKHSRYDDYLKRMLQLMDDRMSGWAQVCPLCDKGKKPKFQPSVRVNQVLDNLSRVVRRKISPPLPRWEIFISRYALEAHKPVCPHGVEDL